MSSLDVLCLEGRAPEADEGVVGGLERVRPDLRNGRNITPSHKVE